jgi:hypothetical protein
MDRTMLIYGESGTGKSTSLRNLDFSKTALCNVEGKALPFRGASKLLFHSKPKNLNEIKMKLKEYIENPDIENIIFDSITMFGDNILYPEIVKTTVNERGEPDTRSGWQLYKDNLVAMLDYCKKSGKNFIFIALEKEVYNKKEMVEKTVPSIQGSMANSLSSHFTYVFYSSTIEEDGELKYVFQTNRTIDRKDVTAKTPMGMFDSLYIENDVKKAIERMEEWDEENNS